MKTRTLVTFFVLLFAGLFVMSVGIAAAPAMPALPGINAPDAQPKACVDCHVNAGGKDFRLSAVLAGLKGGHPDVSKLVRNVPSDCSKCHYASAKAPALGGMVHRNHYANLVNNDFLITDKGSCLTCHNIDLKSGKIGWKNGPANW